MINFFKTNFFICTLGLVFVLLFTSCGDKKSSKLFQLHTPEHTGIDFINKLTFDKDFNIYTYRNYYNGGGVAVADVNNDGLLDIYFTANQESNRLYLNKGNFQFEDITEQAGVAGSRAWSTGVSMADVNGDGLIDIYVCNSGDIAGDNKQNELFINNGDLTFTEQAEKYGLADQGFSTHAAFFDYDQDGDLDVYLLNNSYTAIGSFNLMQNIRGTRDEVGGDKLYRNDDGVFIDVSVEAGIYGSEIGFGLGVTVGDVNGDGWMDIFVSNDFFEKDYLYVNQRDGTFLECLESSMRSISAASMGADMADINNDLYPDIFVTDMLPEPDSRIKQVTTFESWDKYVYKLQTGYFHQFSRNMLHVNNGDGKFTELGRLAGVSATDWSWGALIFDMDNDGWKDLFVANGIYQDITDLDYLNFIADDETKRKIITREGVDYAALVNPIPINPIPNYAYKNRGGILFDNLADDWGLSQPSHSNGAVYADLDNDGDLDLIVNNVNAKAFVYENHLSGENAYLKLTLKGTGGNTGAFGSKIYVYTDAGTYYQELMPIRGFQSTVDPRPNFGLGKAEIVNQIRVLWPNGQESVLENVNVNQHLVLDIQDAKAVNPDSQLQRAKQAPWVSATEMDFPFTHEENQFVDFDRDRLTFYMRSNEGPAVAKADVNGDGLEDFYLGGAKGFSGVLLVQQTNGTFKSTNDIVWQADKGSEDVDALFFDADGDGDMDLFVVSGGNEFGYLSPELSDRLYLNNGKGEFTKSDQTLLTNQKFPGSVVRAADYDGDGDMDLFVGGRLMPFLYGVSASSFIYQNDGKGIFSDVTDEVANGLKEVGMVTSADWIDFNQDGLLDLVMVGEWMSPTILLQLNGRFERLESGLENYLGWWYSLIVRDLDGDGHVDLLMGNHGLNSRFKPTIEDPLFLYINDFDDNGTVEQIFVRKEGSKLLPYVLKHDLVAQIPSLKKKYLKYENYRHQTLNDVFSVEKLAKARVAKATWFETSVAWGNGDGTFRLEALPLEAQYAPVYAWWTGDVNGDGRDEVVLGGNLYRVKPQMGIYDANHGTAFTINEQRQFSYVNYLTSGLFMSGEIRDFQSFETDNGSFLMAIRNSDTPIIYQLNK